jgi:hypothetical protein
MSHSNKSVLITDKGKLPVNKKDKVPGQNVENVDPIATTPKEKPSIFTLLRH